MLISLVKKTSNPNVEFGKNRPTIELSFNHTHLGLIVRVMLVIKFIYKLYIKGM